MKKKNLKPFFPVGICFMGAGVVFLVAINEGVGAALIGLGVLYMILGGNALKKRKK